LNSSSTSN